MRLNRGALSCHQNMLTFSHSPRRAPLNQHVEGMKILLMQGPLDVALVVIYCRAPSLPKGTEAVDSALLAPRLAAQLPPAWSSLDLPAPNPVSPVNFQPRALDEIGPLQATFRDARQAQSLDHTIDAAFLQVKGSCIGEEGLLHAEIEPKGHHGSKGEDNPRLSSPRWRLELDSFVPDTRFYPLQRPPESVFEISLPP